MALASRCSTPRAVYNTSIHPGGIVATVSLPHDLDLTEAEAEHLEATIHNALELALAPLFVSQGD